MLFDIRHWKQSKQSCKRHSAISNRKRLLWRRRRRKPSRRRPISKRNNAKVKNRRAICVLDIHSSNIVVCFFKAEAKERELEAIKRELEAKERELEQKQRDLEEKERELAEAVQV
jgi:hypothetical protein